MCPLKRPAKDHDMKNLYLVLFSILCLGCAAGMAFLLFDIVTSAGAPPIAGYGVVAVMVMILAMAVRHLAGRIS